MIVELARLSIRPGSEAEFEEAVAQARGVFARARGFQTLALHRIIEQPGVYMLLLHWATLEDHTEHFRKSSLFAEWRALVGPFFASPPEVLHGAPVTLPA